IGRSLGEHERVPPGSSDPVSALPAESAGERQALSMIDEGRKIFRYDTFGDEDFWGGSLRLHQAIAGAKLGGVGPGLSPKAALALGLKVDSQALPPAAVTLISQGKLAMDDPANTVYLLQINAVVGLKAILDSHNNVTSVGIQCALCHSTVDNS